MGAAVGVGVCMEADSAWREETHLHVPAGSDHRNEGFLIAYHNNKGYRRLEFASAGIRVELAEVAGIERGQGGLDDLSRSSGTLQAEVGFRAQSGHSLPCILASEESG